MGGTAKIETMRWLAVGCAWCAVASGQWIHYPTSGVPLGKDGKPRPELYVSDGEHMTPEGYKIWTRLVTPLIQ